MIAELVVRWGYPAIVLGTFFEGEAVLLLAGAMAHRGLLSLPLVMLAAFVGSVAGDQLWFYVGKRLGRPAVERRPRWKRQVARFERWLARWGAAFVLGFRFLYGLRTVSPVLLGASGYSPRLFSLLNAIGGAVWAIAFAALGWGLGEGFRRALGRHARWEELGFVFVLLFVVAAFARRKATTTEPTA
jgi:membrane protein DedA with SNARE-associated domain